MSDKTKSLTGRASLFDDTTELRSWLIERAERDCVTLEDKYYLKEIQVSLGGLHDLVHDMAQHIIREGCEQ
jgi:hypothetical protein